MQGARCPSDRAQPFGTTWLVGSRSSYGRPSLGAAVAFALTDGFENTHDWGGLKIVGRIGSIVEYRGKLVRQYECLSLRRPAAAISSRLFLYIRLHLNSWATTESNRDEALYLLD